MNDLDLDITNYSYDDLLKIFKINDIESIESREKLSEIIDKKMKNVKTNYSNNIYIFFYKGKIILLSIYDLFKGDHIKDINTVDIWLDRIKRFNNLENYNEVGLFTELIESNSNFTDFYNNKIIKDNQSIPNIKPDINTPYYELAGRANPSLNNKNNTNLIYNTATNEISPGELNSLKRITQLLNVNINSCFRDNYYKSNPCDFIYSFPNEIYNVISLRLVSIEIPNSWYLFSSKKRNNIFKIVINNKDCFELEIPDGNYNNDTLEEYLNTTYFYESELETPLKKIKFSINHKNLKSSFEVIQNHEEDNEDNNFRFALQFSQDINQNIMNTFGWIIGFRLGNYVDINEYIVSESLFDAGGDRYVYLCLNDYQYNNNTSNIVFFDKSSLNEDVIAKIPMVNGKLSLIINNNNNNLAKLRRYNGPINISKMQIKILDKFGNVIDLNNMDFSMTLELELLYENFNFKNVSH